MSSQACCRALGSLWATLWAQPSAQQGSSRHQQELAVYWVGKAERWARGGWVVRVGEMQLFALQTAVRKLCFFVYYGGYLGLRAISSFLQLIVVQGEGEKRLYPEGLWAVFRLHGHLLNFFPARWIHPERTLMAGFSRLPSFLLHIFLAAFLT